jgi:hypothetical protein
MLYEFSVPWWCVSARRVPGRSVPRKNDPWTNRPLDLTSPGRGVPWQCVPLGTDNPSGFFAKQTKRPREDVSSIFNFYCQHYDTHCFIQGTVSPGDCSSRGHFVLGTLRYKNLGDGSLRGRIARDGDASSGYRMIGPQHCTVFHVFYCWNFPTVNSTVLYYWIYRYTVYYSYS